MKVITIPADVPCVVNVKDANTGAVEEKESPFKFLDALLSICRSHDPFRCGPEKGEQFLKIKEVIKSHNGMDTLELEDADHAEILKAIPKMKWPTAEINAACGPSYKAILEAKTVKVEPKKEEPKKK